jgi:hypothetical protein
MGDPEIEAQGTQDRILRVLRDILAVEQQTLDAVEQILEDTDELIVQSQENLIVAKQNLESSLRIEQLLQKGAFTVSYERILPPAAIEVRYEKTEREESWPIS